MCEEGEGMKGRELPIEGTMLPESMEEIIHEHGTQPHQRSRFWKYAHVRRKDHSNETPSD